MLTNRESSRTSEDCLSDLRLDELRVGELSTSDEAAASKHIAECERCSQRAASLAMATDLPELPPRRQQPAPIVQVHRAKNRRVGLVVVGTLLAAAVALFMIGSSDRSDRVRRQHDLQSAGTSTQVKGGPSLGAYVRRGDTTTKWAPHESVRSGDVLQFVYSSDLDQTVALFDVEDDTIAPLFPTTGTTHAIPRGRDIELQVAVAVDASETDESIVGVFCLQAVPIDTLQRALEKNPSGPRFPPGCRGTQMRLRKSNP